MNENTSLVLLKHADQALAEATTVIKAKELMDLALTAADWLKRKNMGDDIVLKAKALALDAERKMGEMLKTIEKATGGKPYQQSSSTSTIKVLVERRTTLNEAGISKKQSAKAQKLATIPKETFEEIKKGKEKVSHAIAKIKKEEVKQQIAKIKESTTAIDIIATEKKYQIIYADPPWNYREGGSKNASQHYGCMTIDEIKALPIKKLADDNCILFIWVIGPMLHASFDVIEAWGFNYKTIGFCWVKKNKKSDTPFFGLGSWTRANCELCLIATKGSLLRLDASISQVIESVIEEHSKKPAIVRDLIIRLVGKRPRIELFSRKVIEGWDCWGNEVVEQVEKDKKEVESDG